MPTKDISAQILFQLKEIATDVAATQQRVADIESRVVTQGDMAEVRIMMRGIEKRLTALEAKSVTKQDLKVGLARLERKINSKFTKLFDFLDGDVMRLQKRVNHLERNLIITPN